MVVILGPTAAGKTKAALDVVPRFSGEIISADSMQVYRYLNIGTAKPDEAEQRIVKHHLIDVADPDEEYSAARFAEEACLRISGIIAQGKVPFVVGGTGLYIDSLLGGLIDGPPADPELRAHYKRCLVQRGSSYLHQLLQRRDEAAAARIHPHDAVRIIRALEVWDYTGGSIVIRQKGHGFKEENYQYIKIGLNTERPRLFERISERTTCMIRDGLIQEVEDLLSRGYSDKCLPLQSFSYRSVIEFLKGKLSMDEMNRIIARDTRHYAKRQLTWFKRDDRIMWFQPWECNRIKETIKKFLESPVNRHVG